MSLTIICGLEFTISLIVDAVVNFYDNNGRGVVIEVINEGQVVLDVSYFYPGVYHIECVTRRGRLKSSFFKTK